MRKSKVSERISSYHSRTKSLMRKVQRQKGKSRSSDALKNQIIKKIEMLPEGKMLEVMDFVDFILTKSSHPKAKPIEASDAEMLRAIEASGSLNFYYDDSQDVYTLHDGEPL